MDDSTPAMSRHPVAARGDRPTLSRARYAVDYDDWTTWLSVHRWLSPEILLSCEEQRADGGELAWSFLQVGAYADGKLDALHTWQAEHRAKAIAFAQRSATPGRRSQR